MDGHGGNGSLGAVVLPAGEVRMGAGGGRRPKAGSEILHLGPENCGMIEIVKAGARHLSDFYRPKTRRRIA